MIFIRLIVAVLVLISLSDNSRANDTLPLPVRTLRVAIHVFQDDNGTGNFQRDSLVEEEFLRKLVGWVNHRLANLDTLRPVMPSPFIGDARVQIRLDTLFYHRDSKAWDASVEIDAPYMRDRYVDGDTLLDYKQKYQTLPVLIGANNSVVGGNSRNLGDRGYIAVHGYYESFNRQTLAEALDECGRNLVHELCHCLGLMHNFTGGPNGEQCDNCEDNGCPVEGTSNNMMDYWPSYGYAISECQFKLVHYHLDGFRGNISEVIINDSCYRLPGEGFVVASGDTVIISDTLYAHQNWLVKSGGLLRVTGYLSMPGETGIQLESGSQLEIDGGTIGNLCGDLWMGVRISDTVSTSPAFVSLVNNGLIEHARTGILADGRVSAIYENSLFRNCVESIVYSPGASDTLVVKNSRFTITNKLNHYEEGVTPEYFIHADGLLCMDISGCQFVNEPGTSVFDADWMGTGILSNARMIQVKDSQFKNLTTGLDLQSTTIESRLDVERNQFIHNRYGVKSGFSGLQWISENRMMLQRFNSGSTIGVFLRHPDRFSICRNSFESEFGGGMMAGVVMSDPTSENSSIFNNGFSNLPVGVFLDDFPAIEPGLFHWAATADEGGDLKLGPQFRFNIFDLVTMPLAAVSDSVYGTAVSFKWDLLKEFSTPPTLWCTGAFLWYNPQAQIAAFHGWKDQSAAEKGHGLYWFMNFLGLSQIETDKPSQMGYRLVVEYLLKLTAVAEADDYFAGLDAHSALNKISEVPAALRSARLPNLWNRFGGEDQLWLRESLASLAGRFSIEDSLLTHLGTDLAIRNRIKWVASPVTVGPPDSLKVRTKPLPGFNFPDMTLFGFDRLSEASIPPPKYRVFPNPAVENVVIEPLAGISFGNGWNGKIISADGRFSRSVIINSWVDQKIDISDLSSGVYILELYSGIEYLGAAKFLKITQR
jgi:hypothetical protein